jgi:tetratricopeptide (TPR) repeat protein
VRQFTHATFLVLTFIPCAVFAQFASEQDRREAWQHYRAGREHMSAERFVQAAEAFQRSIDNDPLMTAAHYGLGEAYMALRRYPSAVRAFSECRDAHLRLYGLAERGRIDLEKQREDEIRELRETMQRLAQVPQSQLRMLRVEARIQELQRQRTSNTGGFVVPAELSLALGSAHFRNGQLDHAETAWTAAIAANARLGEAHNNLAALYAMTGRKRQAEDAIRAAESTGFRVNPQLKADVRALP